MRQKSFAPLQATLPVQADSLLDFLEFQSLRGQQNNSGPGREALLRLARTSEACCERSQACAAHDNAHKVDGIVRIVRRFVGQLRLPGP